MFKAMVKKGKSNKGFTLIELIVVIAIIAILALILVPRFAGFTNNAKVNADNATAKTLESAIATMVADGSISVAGADGTFSVGDNTAITAGPSNITLKSGVTSLGAILVNLVGNGVQHQSGGATDYFDVRITSNGGITVDPNT